MNISKLVLATLLSIPVVQAQDFHIEKSNKLKDDKVHVNDLTKEELQNLVKSLLMNKKINQESSNELIEMNNDNYRHFLDIEEDFEYVDIDELENVLQRYDATRPRVED